MKKFLVLLLALAMMLSLAACLPQIPDLPGGSSGGSSSGGSSNSPSGGGSGGAFNTSLKSYADAYDFHTGMVEKMTSLVTRSAEANNERLEEALPSGYASDPTYWSPFFLPFVSISMAYTSSLGSSSSNAGTIMVYQMFGGDDVKCNETGNGKYEITYTDSDSVPIRVLAEFDQPTGSMRFVEYSDGKLSEFLEFVGLGGDRYAVQDDQCRAIITYKNGEVTDFSFAQLIQDVDWETDELVYGKEWGESDFIFGRGGMDDNWVRAGGELNNLLRSTADGQLTVHKQASTYDYNTGKSSYSWNDPFTIPVVS